MRIITTTQALADACQELSAHPFVTVDTEFKRETTYWPELCLIQVAGPERQYIIDPLARQIDLGPFFALMDDERVLKVFHAARQDIEIMVHRGGVIPRPLFDTQVAAMVCGFGEAVSYENIVRHITGHRVDKSSRFTDWAHRPLSDRQLQYALSDVTHLRDVYRKLAAELDRTGRGTWVAEEMAVLESPETYRLDPREAWRRLKVRPRSREMLAVLIELAAWRETEAQQRNVPRNRVLRDDALVEIATQRPTREGDLKRLRAVSKNFASSQHAQGVLEAVHRGKAADPASLPELPDEQPVNGHGAIVEMLKVALRLASERHQVAPKLIATVSDLERIAADDDADVPALRGWRRELFGESALALKHGRKALTLEKGEAVLIPREPGRSPGAAVAEPVK